MPHRNHSFLDRIKSSAWIPGGAAFAIGAVAGLLLVWGFGVDRSSGVPAGWSGSAPVVRFQPAGSADELHRVPWAWSLERHASLRAGEAAGRFEIRGRLSPRGELWVFPAADGWDPPRGPALQLLGDADRPPRAVELAAAPDPTLRGGAPLSCEGELPAPGTDPWTLSVERTDNGYVFRCGGGELRCRAPAGVGVPTLMAGLDRVQLTRLERDGRRTKRPLAAFALVGAAALGALLLLALGRAERKLGRRTATILVTSAPLLIGLVFLRTEPARLAEALYFEVLDTPHLPALVGLGAAVAAKLMVFAAALLKPAPVGASPPRFARVAAGVALPALGALAAGVMARAPAPTLVWMAGAGAFAGGLLWVNLHAARVRYVNLLSLLAVAAGLVCSEMALRHSATGESWRLADLWGERWLAAAADSQGAEAQPATGIDGPSTHPLWEAQRDFRLLESLPSATFPEQLSRAPLEPRRAATRIVALGGSSTAGFGLTPDVPDEAFYPAKLDERLGPQVEVVNQGRGGFTTYHIRLHVSAHLERLDPDLLTLYVGSNDCAARLPMSWEQLHGAWQRRRALSRVLDSLRGLALYQGLVHLIYGLAGSGEAVPAVTLAEAEHNLRVIIDRAADKGADVLLIGEGQAPARLDELRPYHGMMRDLADDLEHVHWLDGASVLDAAAPGMFVDAVHLTSSGHALLAESIARRLEELELFDAPLE